MAAATVSVTYTNEMGGGMRMAVGTITMPEVYETNGATADLSDYFDGSPIVLLGAGDDGVILQHNRGTAAAGLVLAYYSNSSANAALPEAANAENLSAVIVNFAAFGVHVDAA